MKNLKTGTTTIGIRCSNGIVLAADKRATTYYIAHKDMEKIIPITKNIAVTTAGDVSEIQYIIKLAKAELKLKSLRKGTDVGVKEAVNLFGNIVYYNIRKYSPVLGFTGFLIGGHDEEGPSLYEVEGAGSVIEYKDYSATGSGSVFALGVLDSLYKKGISIEEGIELAKKSLNASMQRDLFTGEGVEIYTITAAGVKRVFTQKIETKIGN